MRQQHRQQPKIRAPERHARIPTTGDRCGAETVFLKVVPQQFADLPVVVHDQNMPMSVHDMTTRSESRKLGTNDSRHARKTAL